MNSRWPSNVYVCSYTADFMQFSVEVGLKCQHFRPTCCTDRDAANRCVTAISVIQTFRWSLNSLGLDLQLAVISQRQISFLSPCWTLNWECSVSLWLFNCWTKLFVRLALKHILVIFDYVKLSGTICKNQSSKKRCFVAFSAIFSVHVI